MDFSLIILTEKLSVFIENGFLVCKKKKTHIYKKKKNNKTTEIKKVIINKLGNNILDM